MIAIFNRQKPEDISAENGRQLHFRMGYSAVQLWDVIMSFYFEFRVYKHPAAQCDGVVKMLKFS